MALLDDVKLACRITGTSLDSEVQIWIDAALADMRRVGVDPSTLSTSTIKGLQKAAVICYCKGQLGYDNDEAPRFLASYRQIVCDLLNSSDNVADVED